MVAPIDYSLNVKDPFQSAVQGIQLGSTIAQANAAEQQRAFEMQARQEELRRQAEIRSRISALAENKNATAQDYVNIAMMLPEKEAASVRANWETLSKENQQSTVRSMGEALSAFKAGKTEIGLDLVRRQAEAFRNSGQEDQARQVEALAEAYEQDPSFATTHLGLTLAAVPGGKEALEGIDKFLGIKRTEAEAPFKLRTATAEAITKEAESRIKTAEAKLAPDQLAAELGLTQAQIDQAKAARRASDAAARKSGAEADKASAEAKQISAGVIPADKRPEAEAKFRKEYKDNTEDFRKVSDSYSRVQSAEQTGAGDLALIFNYMKMLDPGSVVREGEFATAENAGGGFAKVGNLYNKLLSGERLNDNQRKMFISQSRKLYTAAQEGEKKVRSGIERIAKGYGLNPDNIFYETEGVTEPTGGVPQPPAQPAQPSSTGEFRVIRRVPAGG